MEASSRTSRRTRTYAIAAIAALACSGATSCTRTEIVLSVTAMAAVVVGTTVGVTYAVQNQHHTLQGCVFYGPRGPGLRTSESAVYALEGETAAIKDGDRVKLHGSKLKKTKGSTADQVFVVDKLKKDYGSCPKDYGRNPAAAAAPATPTQ